ncbi:MAG: CHRD domain-containing protein [Solirubrobacteraceae bacterium]
MTRTRGVTLTAIVAGMMAVAGCGSSSSSSSASGTPHARAHHAHGRSHVYRLELTGGAETPPGAPSGGGSAVIALHDSSHRVCWRFSHLHGFTSATFAHIHHGTKGTSGPVVVALSLTPKLHHRGCVASGPSLIKAIESDPSGYYVNIHSRAYPGGAVRAQL